MPSCGFGGQCTEMLSSPKPNPASFGPIGEKVSDADGRAATADAVMLL